MLRMGVPPPIEVMQSILGVAFEECWPRRVVVEDGESIPVISLSISKRTSGPAAQDLLESRS
jgi:hypothetical protein